MGLFWVAFVLQGLESLQIKSEKVAFCLGASFCVFFSPCRKAISGDRATNKVTLTIQQNSRDQE
jgi:hypothetical protein